ncbi:hypothetical protein OSTOST_20761 [Ostertagia ostertagi]
MKNSISIETRSVLLAIVLVEISQQLLLNDSRGGMNTSLSVKCSYIRLLTFLGFIYRPSKSITKNIMEQLF